MAEECEISMELAMNFMLGYMLHREKEEVCARTQAHLGHGVSKYVLKISDWLDENVMSKIKAYDLDQNVEWLKEDTLRVEEEDDGQRAYIAVCVRELLSDYQYEEVAMRRKLKKASDEAMQVKTNTCDDFFFFLLVCFCVFLKEK